MSEETKLPIDEVKRSIKSVELTDDQATKLAQLLSSIPNILGKTDKPEYDEIFGHRINTDDKEYVDIPKRNEILLKFLAADAYDLSLSTERIIKTLNWRHRFQPLRAAFEEKFNKELDDLGVVTNFPSANANLHIITWNLYGNLKNPKNLFEKFGGSVNKDLPGSQFIRWRVGLMEKTLQLIDFQDSNNNKIGQIHDYNNVSLFKIDPGMKHATKEVIEIFGSNYPELLSTKFFINVPLLMGWVFTFFKTIGVISAETLKKFQVLNHGDLSEVLPKSELPVTYCGSDKEKKSIFDLDVSKDIKLSEYGQIMLKKIGDEEIEHINDEVE
ncbi:SFH5 [Candida oxycetoniae]|uniref:Phosphatidylinositol transfer protein SFH5 n=1 Tax=Candida oxycetoniae TaxID=497107 RepID=A0AAI9STG2_9ASCO|nr:SFH5 [Candida oxycetoniae]KAI3402702.2 SFH5 [Candida oxycetoniae]